MSDFKHVQFVFNTALSTEEGKAQLDDYKEAFPELYESLVNRTKQHEEIMNKINPDKKVINPFIGFKKGKKDE